MKDILIRDNDGQPEIGTGKKWWPVAAEIVAEFKNLPPEYVLERSITAAISTAVEFEPVVSDGVLSVPVKLKTKTKSK